MPLAKAGRLSQASSVRTFHIGSHKLTYIPDGAVQLDPLAWLPDSTNADWRQWEEYLDEEGYLIGSIGGLLVEHEGRTLLIDAGYGPHRVPAAWTHPALGELAGGQLLSNFESLGRTPDTVETVAFTHLDDDHVGWAFKLEKDSGLLF